MDDNNIVIEDFQARTERRLKALEEWSETFKKVLDKHLEHIQKLQQCIEVVARRSALPP
jgi:DNA topoisomerase IA